MKNLLAIRYIFVIIKANAFYEIIYIKQQPIALMSFPLCYFQIFQIFQKKRIPINC